MSILVVVFEYVQALLMLVYYWIKALGRILFVQKIKKNVENEIILITGAGLFYKLGTKKPVVSKFFFFFSIFPKGSGLGRGLAKRFASLGATVVLWDVNQKGNEDTKRQILENYSGAKVYSMTVDLCDRNDIYRVAEQVNRLNLSFSYFLFIFLYQVRDQVGDVTMVINNAGVVSGKLLLDLDDRSIQRTFDVNIIAHFWVFIFIF